MTFRQTDFNSVDNIARGDVAALISKGKSYGDSWRRRGGVGAFMMLARKWDRIEQQAMASQYDIFDAADQTFSEPDGLLDDIADLRRYLLLVEEHVRAHATEVGPGPGYVNQD